MFIKVSPYYIPQDTHTEKYPKLRMCLICPECNTHYNIHTKDTSSIFLSDVMAV